MPALPLLFVFAFVASALLGARVPPVVTWLDVGSPGDEPYTRFDFPPESNGNETFRWTTDHAGLDIPVGRSGAYRLDLLLAAVLPDNRILQVTCGDQQYAIPLATLDADSTVPVTCSTASDRVSVAFDVPVVYLPNGGRALGVSVRDVRATALDGDDRFYFRATAALTIFGSLAGAGLALAALRRNVWFWLTGMGVVLLAWFEIIFGAPDTTLSAVAGPQGLVILAGGVAAYLLSTGRRWNALAVGALGVVAVIGVPQPEASLLLEAPWTRIEVNALRVLPGLAVIGIFGASALGTRNSAWLASGSSAVGLVSVFMPALSSLTVGRWTHTIRGPAWLDTGSVAGAVYVTSAFAMIGLAIIVVRSAQRRLLLRVTLAAGMIVASLLLWRIEVMRLNGDEQHYYVTARSIAVDGDLELLNNYLEPQYVRSTYSPVGNIFPTRDREAGRYAGAVPGIPGSWYLVPPIDEGWEVLGGGPGLTPAAGPAPTMRGPAGALAIPPPLTPATRHSLLITGPCDVQELALAAPSGDETEVRLQIFGASGDLLYTHPPGPLPADGLLRLPTESALCGDGGPWAVVVETDAIPIVVETVDRWRGLSLASGQLQPAWLFTGMPRDRYGSVEVEVQLLLHNPSDALLLATVRLITASNLTMSEISIGVPPGQTVTEALPIYGAEALSILATPDVEFGAALFGFVESTRYRMAATSQVASFDARVDANSDHDAGLWLSVANLHDEPILATIQDSETVGPETVTTLEICGTCAITHHLPAGETDRIIHVEGVGNAPIAPAALAYEERTGELHFDLVLPLLAAPLAGFDEYWPVLIATALAGLTLAPGIFLLLRASGIGAQGAATAALIALTLAPLSTYAVRFYTDIVSAAFLVWAVVCWSRADRSQLPVAGMFGIAMVLPFVHGRMTPLAIVVLALALFSLAGQTCFFQRFMDRYPRWIGITAIIAGLGSIGIVGYIILQRYAVALGARGVEGYFRLEWVAPNTIGMIFDRGSGVLPYMPWLLFALAVPRPLHRAQRAALLLSVVSFTVLAMRTGGWQTFGSPLRYLLPVLPLVATLALPGMLRLWRTGQLAWKILILASLSWSLLVTMLLHWRPLAGYIDRGGASNNYLIDEALSWLPVRSPFEFMPSFEAGPGPAWAEPIGLIILVSLCGAIAWIVVGIIRSSGREIRALLSGVLRSLRPSPTQRSE